MATAIGDLVARLRMDSRGFRRGAKQATGMMTVMNGAASALTASLIGGGGLAYAFVKMGQTANQFEGAMNRSLAIMSDVNASIRKDMKKTALAVSRDTQFSAKEAAEAYFFLASAGLNAKQSLAALPAVSRFAQAGNFDLSLATDLATDALSALGLKSADAAVNARNLEHVMDNLTEANRHANASIEQFSRAITNKGGAAMRLLGMEIEEGLAVLSVWADQGIKAQDAGTRMEIVFRDLTTKAIQNAEAFKKMGVEVFKFGEVRPIADIIEDMSRKLLPLTDRGRKAGLMFLGFTDRTVNATASLLGFSDEMREYERNQKNAAGATDVVSDHLTELDRAWAKAGAAMETISTEFMPPVLEEFARLTSSIADSTGALKDNREEITAWKKAGEITASGGAGLITFARMVGALASAPFSDNAGMTKEEMGARFRRQVFGIRKPVGFSSNVRAKDQKARDAAAQKSLQKRASGLFGSGSPQASGVAFAAEDFMGDARRMAGVGSGKFDFGTKATEIDELRELIGKLATIQPGSMIGGIGPKQAARQLPGMREDLHALAEDFFDATKKAQAHAMKAGAALFEQTRTPMEEYNKRIEDINNLLRVGALGEPGGPMAQSTAARAREQASKTLAAALDSLDGSVTSLDKQFAAAMTKGSVEAYSTIIHAARNRSRRGGPVSADSPPPPFRNLRAEARMRRAEEASFAANEIRIAERRATAAYDAAGGREGIARQEQIFKKHGEVSAMADERRRGGAVGQRRAGEAGFNNSDAKFWNEEILKRDTKTQKQQLDVLKEISQKVGAPDPEVSIPQA